MEAKKTALVIDDDEMIRQFLFDLLTSAGFSAVCCADGAAALELIKGERFQLIVTDYHMEGMNGADIAKALRLHSPESWIIGISGERKERDFLEAGADAFCRKPFTARELLSLIKKRGFHDIFYHEHY